MVAAAQKNNESDANKKTNPFEALGGYAGTTPPIQHNKETNNEVAASKNPFEALGGYAGTQQQTVQVQYEDSPTRMAAQAARTAVAGAVGGLADFAALAYNIPAAIINGASEKTEIGEKNAQEAKQRLEKNPFDVQGRMYERYKMRGEGTKDDKGNLPKARLIPSAELALRKGIDNATKGYTKPSDSKTSKVAEEAVSFASQMWSPGAIASAAGKQGVKYLEKAFKLLGSTKKTDVAAAAVTGGVTQAIRNEDKGELNAALGGLGAGVATSLAAAGGKSAAIRALGHNPKNVDLKTVDAASRVQFGLPYERLTPKQKENLNISTTLVNDNQRLTNYEKIVEQVPFVGAAHKEKIAKHDRAFKGEVENLVHNQGELVGDNLTTGQNLHDAGKFLKENLEAAKGSAKKESETLYSNATSALPENAQIKSNHTIEKINSLEKNFGKGMSADEQYVANYIKDIRELFLLPTSSGAGFAIPTPVKDLVRLKKSLNDTINWDVAASGPKNLLRDIRTSLVKDIEEYGKTNKEWFDSYKKADAYYAKTLGSDALGSDTSKYILSLQDPEKAIRYLNKSSDFKKLKSSLSHVPDGDRIYNSIKAEKLRDILLETSLEKGNQGVNYNNFSKILDSKSKGQETQAMLIKELLGESEFKKIIDLGAIAKAQVQKSNRVSNKSGTAYTTAALGLVTTDLAYIFSGGFQQGLLKLAGHGSLFVAATQVITNKKLLNYSINAAKAAEKRNMKDVSKWEKLINEESVKEIGQAEFNKLRSTVNSVMRSKEDKKK